MLALALVLALVGDGSTQTPSRVLISSVDDAVPRPVAESLVKQAVGAFGEHGWTVDAENGRCADGASAACRAAVGRPRLRLQISQEASDYTVRVGSVDAAGDVVGEVSHVCRICRQSELGGAVTAAVDAFVAAAPGHLSVVSTPSGAAVWVDGAEAGVTPLDLELAAGTHEVEVRAEGHQEARDAIEVEHGGVHRSSFTLQARSRGVSPRTEEVLGWTGVAVGVAGLAAGIALVVLDEREIQGECSGSDVDLDGDCRYLHDTVVPGGVLLGSGALVGAAGGVLVWHGRKRRRSEGQRAQIRIAPTGVRARF
jgi:hypothetical protein